MKYFLSLTVLLASLNLSAQDADVQATRDKKLAHLDIHTSTVCDMCEKTIEENLIYERGVKSVSVDLATSAIHVEYDARKTDASAIRTAVTKLGYAADDLPGDEAAFKELPACCQKEGCGKMPEKKE